MTNDDGDDNDEFYHANDACTWDTADAEAPSCCVVSDSTATVITSSVTTTTVRDEETDHPHPHHQQQQQQQQQQDKVADFKDDNSVLISGTKSEDQAADSDRKNTSSCRFPSNVVAMSTAKLPAGMRQDLSSTICGNLKRCSVWRPRQQLPTQPLKLYMYVQHQCTLTLWAF